MLHGGTTVFSVGWGIHYKYRSESVKEKKKKQRKKDKMLKKISVVRQLSWEPSATAPFISAAVPINS